MASKILGLVAITVLLSTILVMALFHDQYAEAKPSSKSPKHKFNKWHSNKVCGDKICEKFFNKIPTKIGRGSPHR
ncbi:MAG TPA: hypothetical protein VNK44_00070 [Candidatus Nitrosotenuis sp.]|nr:hypothetical protein [Candidatus Nitrosotenuis sp.]